jgi:hypothetical protein
MPQLAEAHGAIEHVDDVIHMVTMYADGIV